MCRARAGRQLAMLCYFRRAALECGPHRAAGTRHRIPILTDRSRRLAQGAGAPASPPARRPYSRPAQPASPRPPWWAGSGWPSWPLATWTSGPWTLRGTCAASPAPSPRRAAAAPPTGWVLWCAVDLLLALPAAGTVGVQSGAAAALPTRATACRYRPQRRHRGPLPARPPNAALPGANPQTLSLCSSPTQIGRWGRSWRSLATAARTTSWSTTPWSTRGWVRPGGGLLWPAVVMCCLHSPTHPAEYGAAGLAERRAAECSGRRLQRDAGRRWAPLPCQAPAHLPAAHLSPLPPPPPQECIAELLRGGHSDGIVCDVGMPVMHRGVRYNCRSALGALWSHAARCWGLGIAAAAAAAAAGRALARPCARGVAGMLVLGPVFKTGYPVSCSHCYAPTPSQSVPA